jgi:sporulation protein YlmC with PRC-barrel domain
VIYYGRELMSRMVFDARTGKRLGKVTQVIWDPTNGQLLGFRVGGPEAGEQVVSQTQITAIEPGKITITPGEGAFVREAEPAGLGKQLVTDDGQVLGPVTDVIFDFGTQQVLAYEVIREGKPLVVPMVLPIRESATEIEVPAEALLHAAPDLSALIAHRDPATGVIMFPLSEEPPPV